MTKLTSEQLRKNRTATLRDHTARVKQHAQEASDVVRRRDEDLEAWQGKPSEGKFSYTELAAITGLSRTRVTQIVRDVRRRKGQRPKVKR